MQRRVRHLQARDPARRSRSRLWHQRIGRLLFVGIPHGTLDEATRQVLERLQVGGVVLFRRNTGPPRDVRVLTAALHALPSRPLVAIDHEGGRVMRLGDPFTQFPAAAEIGRTRDKRLAYRIGRAMAEELSGVGIDVSFAPVLDVHSNPANPIIGDRAFGSDPALVRDMGVAMMRGLRAGGVIPCAKHFPGHGATDTDSHLELPVVQRSREELECTELLPFRAAIAAGVPMLMTAHVRYPALDAAPATLSRPILTHLLREELRFDGVVASDDLTMRAIAAHQAVPEASVAALRAGADALLVCQELAHALAAFEAIATALHDGTLAPDVVRAASDRLRRLRASHVVRRRTTLDLPSAKHRALLEALHRRKS